MAEPQALSSSSSSNNQDEHRGRVLHRESIADNVNLYIVEKPDGFEFRPGQAVELAVDRDGYREKKRPFTITSLPNNPRLEFVIKSYPTEQFPDHGGVTEYLDRDVEVNDRVIFGDPWGTIEYKGPGVFIAGGAGITPFLAILRQLEKDAAVAGNRLFFSNKKLDDVFLQGELFRLLGRSVVLTLTQQKHRNYEYGRIDKQWMEQRVQDFSQPFYLCGPPPMVEDLTQALEELGAKTDSIVFEE